MYLVITNSSLLSSFFFLVRIINISQSVMTTSSYVQMVCAWVSMFLYPSFRESTVSSAVRIASPTKRSTPPF